MELLKWIVVLNDYGVVPFDIRYDCEVKKNKYKQYCMDLRNIVQVILNQ